MSSPIRDARLLLAAGIGALLLIGAPAHGQDPAASIVASDFAFRTAAGGAANVTVTPGAGVTFSYPAGMAVHNVVFTGAQPSSCTVTGAAGPAPPLPAQPSAPGWSGTCTFTSEGTYAFVCGAHDFMTGSVTVAPAGQPPPPPPPPPPPAGVPPPPPPPPAAGGGAAAASTLRVASVQRGATIRGSLRITHAGSRLLVRALARRRALSGGSSTRRVEVGRRLLASAGPGRVAFAVRLTARARRALRRDGRLAISLRVGVTPPAGGAPFRATRAVVLRSR